MDNIFKDDDYILVSISEGNEKAFERLFYAYKDKVYGVALFFMKNTTDAEEVLQDVFSRIWKYRKKLPEIKNFSAWVITATRHRCLTLLKKIAVENNKRAAMQIISKNQTIKDPENEIQQKELQDLLQTALLCLTPQQRKVFELSRLQGLDRRVVASTLGLSPATVSVHLTIALRRVRSFLFEHSYETLIICVLINIL